MLPALRAERQLAAIEVAAIPHLKDDARRAILDGYRRHTRRDTGRAPGATTKQILAAGIQVEYVNADGSEVNDER